MSSNQLSLEEVHVAEAWLRSTDAVDDDVADTLNRSLKVVRTLLAKELSQKDLLTYLRLQMGILPKSEKLSKEQLAKQFPGSAIFRR